MSKFNLFAKLAQLMGGGANQSSIPQRPLTRMQLKRMRPRGYKPFFTMGHRGYPKTMTPPGSVPAPTIDQVRQRERKYGLKIHVKRGLMFFASDGQMWTKAVAEERSV